MDPRPADSRPPDWEAFYRDYRKPGYVPGFEITTKLGGGMFGLVFRARKQSIGKDYAIKFLQVEDGEVRRAVLAELEQVKHFAQIDHPNLVSIEDRGEVDGIPYLVMSFAGTETLRDRMPAEGRAPSAEQREELLRWYLQACRGIAALHERSLVHFDVKPANVFLKGPVARVGDYGLSKLVTHSRGSLSMGRGTPYYMAPEMLQRRGDHRSDVYSLGVVLYELLCGRVPFRGDSEWEVLRKHETEPPELPGQLSAVERAVLARCLHKDPDARFQSVHDLIAALGAPASAAAADIGDAARPAPAPQRTAPNAGGATARSGEEDPVAGLQRASRQAFGHAQRIARDAMANARDIAQQAVQRAQAAARSHAHGHRRLFGGLFVRWHARRTKAGAKPPVPPAPPARPVRRRRGLKVALAAAGALFLAIAWLTPSSIHMRPATVGTPFGPVALEPRMVAVRVPQSLRAFVSDGEPRWVALADHDLGAAKEQLEAQLQQLEQLAQRIPHAGLSGELPSFEIHTPDRREADRAAAAVGRIAQAKTTAAARQAAKQVARERDTLLVAAQSLALFDWTDPEQRARAGRLQRFLVEATGNDRIELADGDDLPPEELSRRNRAVGTLWLWYLNEVASSERAWNAYRNVRNR